MPTPSHRPASFKANRIFTDRDEARELFAQQCAAPQQQDEYRVLNFYGVGGQGKSALCGQFEKHLDSLPNNEDHQLAWAKINFEDSNKRNPIAALMALRLQLAANGKLWFPAFDTAFARYFAITQAGRNLETSYPELFKQPHDLLQGLAATAEALSGLPLLGKALERLHKADEKRILQRWMETRGTELLTGLEGFSAYKLEDELPSFFGADVDDWLHNETNAPQRRVVFLYDTYEALWRDQPSKTDLLVDKWVRKLVSESPAVLHVMLGREALAWAQQDPEEWQGIITPCPLDHLTDTDADSFLQTVPVVENDIRTRIVESAKGIPFYLNLQVDQYESCKRRNLTPQVDEYGGKEPEMLARFISHLPDTMRRALRVASYPRWLDEALFLNLCEKFLGGAAVISLHELTAYSFWTKQADRYFLHAVMRDYLQAESLEHEATLYRNIHQHLFEYYDDKLQTLTSARELTEEHTEAFNEGIHHLEAIDRPEIPYWVGKYHEKFHLAGQWITLEPLLALSLHIFQEIGNKFGEGRTLNNISQIYSTRGDYNTAFNFLKQSLAIRQEIGDKKGEGTILNNISQIYSARGDYDAALNFLKQSLAIRQEIGDSLGVAQSLNNISQIYDIRGNYNIALDLLRQSLGITQKIGDKIGEGAILNNMFAIAHIHSDYNTAIDFLKESLTIQQEIGNKSGEGTVLNNMATITHTQGDYDTAFDLLKKSLTIQQEIGNKSGEGITLNNMATIAYTRGDYDTAFDLLKQSLDITQEIGDKKGEGLTLNNISQIFEAHGDYDTALHFLKQSLAITQEIGDKKGEGTILNNISQIFKAHGDYDTALHFLKQSLAITQEVGNKAGEGTTLNNISQIYSSRGDYNTAIDFLKQSLDIQQEIGDVAGLCATVFNMGHIHLQNGEVAEAVQAWITVYGIAKKINLANVLQTLEKWASYIGLENGLQGWEKLEKEINQTV